MDSRLFWRAVAKEAVWAVLPESYALSLSHRPAGVGETYLEKVGALMPDQARRICL